jgi:hypothetical protein
VAVACFVAASRYPGNVDVSRSVCASLGSTLTDPATGFCSGAIASLSHDAAYARTQVLLQAQSSEFVHRFAMVAVLALLVPLVMIVRLWSRREDRFAAISIGGCALVSMAASVPLFLYGTDWTRWIYIHTFSMFLLLLFVLRERRVVVAWPASPGLRYAAIALLAIYFFGWNLSPYQPKIPFGGLVHYVMHHRWNDPAGGV